METVADRVLLPQSAAAMVTCAPTIKSEGTALTQPNPNFKGIPIKLESLNSAASQNDRELDELKLQLSHISESLSVKGVQEFCCFDGIHNSEVLDADPKIQNSDGVAETAPICRVVANDAPTRKFGEEYFSESAAPAHFTWFQEDGTCCRYVSDFVFYNNKGERLATLDQLGRQAMELVMFGKARHISLVHSVADLIDTQHPLLQEFPDQRKISSSSAQSQGNPLKIPRRQRNFPIRVKISDWFVDFGANDSEPPCIWVVSENDVYYKLERPSGRYANAFSSSQLMFDVISKIVKNFQSYRDSSLDDLLTLLSESPPAGKEENTAPWNAPIPASGCSMDDINKMLEFIFMECCWYDRFFSNGEGGKFMTQMSNRLREQLPFCCFDEKLMFMDYETKGSLSRRYSYRLMVDLLVKEPKLTKRMQKPQKVKKQPQFDVDEYNAQHSARREIKSKVSGRIIRCGKRMGMEELASVSPATPEEEKQHPKRVAQPQIDAQSSQKLKRLAEIEASCDWLALPSDFEWSCYNTSSEASSEDGTSGVLTLANDVDIPLTNARYYPRDLPLRTLRFYGADDLVEFCDLSRQFSACPSGMSPLLPKLTFQDLETNLLFVTSRENFKGLDPCTFKFIPPKCFCEFLNILSKETSKIEPTADGVHWVASLFIPSLYDSKTTDYESKIDSFYVGLLKPLAEFGKREGFDAYLQGMRDCGELSERKKDLQERDMQSAITDAELVRYFIHNNGGCLYRGRFRRFGIDSDKQMPYVNSLRWNKRFKKVLRIVAGSANYKYTTLRHVQTRDAFTISIDQRPESVPLELFFPQDTSATFKTIFSEDVFEVLPNFMQSFDVWHEEYVAPIRFTSDCFESLNRILKENGLEMYAVEDFVASGEVIQEPILGYGYRERDNLLKSDWLLAPEMLCDFTWPFMIRVYLFYSFYTCRFSYSFKLNSVVWGDLSSNKAQGTPGETGNTSTAANTDVDNEGVDVAANAEGEENEDEEEDEEDEEEEEEETDKAGRGRRRGWGLNRYCPYYEFNLEWIPDSSRVSRLFLGNVSAECIKGTLSKLRNCSFYELEAKERCSLLLWLGELLSYGPTGKSFIDSRNDEFFQLKGQLLKMDSSNDNGNAEVAEDLKDSKKPVKRQKTINKEIAELEERYLQRDVFLGRDRFYNNYIFLGSEFGCRILVQTLPVNRFTQRRCALRSKVLRGPSFGPEKFKFDLAEFAQRFAQDRVFADENRPKRGRAKKVKQEEPKNGKDDNYQEEETVGAPATTSVTKSTPVRTLIKRKRETKSRKNKGIKPYLRRSREFFERHPTHFSTVADYLNYLRVVPPRLCWVVIENLKQLMRFIPRLSQFTTNERNLQMKMQSLEGEFAAAESFVDPPASYKPPTIFGVMLLMLAKAVYRFHMSTVLVVVECSLKIPASDSVTVSHMVNEKVGYNPQKLDLFVRDQISRVIKSCCKGPKECAYSLCRLLELIVLFESLTFQFVKEENTKRMVWRREIGRIYSSALDLASRCDEGIKTESCQCEMTGALEENFEFISKRLIYLAEETGLWFRFFEISHKSSLDALIGLSLPLNTLVADLCSNGLLEFIRCHKTMSTLVYFPGGATESLDSLKAISESQNQPLSDIRDRMSSQLSKAPTETVEVLLKSISAFRVEKLKLVEVELEVVGYGAEECEQGDSEDEDDDLGISKFEDGHLIPNLRRISRGLARLEKTRANKRSAQDITVVQRSPDARESSTFCIIVPIDDDFAQFLVPQSFLASHLEHVWRQSTRCKSSSDPRTGTVRKANYGAADIWRCLAVEWHNNRNKLQSLNLWDITPDH